MAESNIILFMVKLKLVDLIKISAGSIPGFLLESDAHRNAAFCIYNAYQSPKLEITDIKVKKIQGGLKEVTATVVNTQADSHSFSK